MKNRSYNQSIAQAIGMHLSDRGWTYDFHEDDGVFTFNVSVRGKAKSVRYLLVVHDQGFASNAYFPLGPNPEDERELTRMARFLTRANHGLRMGGFEMDMDTGDICYKVYCNCSGIDPTDSMIGESIDCPTAMYERYGAGILDVLFHNADDKEAVMKCEMDVSVRMEALKRQLEALMAARSRGEVLPDDDELPPPPACDPEDYGSLFDAEDLDDAANL